MSTQLRRSATSAYLALAGVLGGAVVAGVLLAGAASTEHDQSGGHAHQMHDHPMHDHPMRDHQMHDRGSHDHQMHAGRSAGPEPSWPPDPIAIGPQGAVAQFLVICELSHRAPDDPIVSPNDPGASHSHDFFGATSTDGFSTAESLLAGGDTTCEDRADTAAYWIPTLYADGLPVDPIEAVAYYRPGPDVDPATVQSWPFGLAVVVGRADATEADPQPLGIVGWHCGISNRLTAEPQDCGDVSPLALRITFPDCWDAIAPTSADNASHMAYSFQGACPDTHPEPVVQLILDVSWPISVADAELSLASGGVHSGHADLLNAWEPDALARHVEVCINRDRVCGVRSNRATG